MKDNSKFTGLLVIAMCIAVLQPAWPQAVNKYLGQTPPGNTIRRFPPDNLQMLANGSWSWHGSPSFSPDGREMFFVKYQHTVDRPAIWHTRLLNNQWTLPVLASFGDQTVIENCPLFSTLGDTLYFYSERDATRGYYYTVRQSGDGWSNPQRLQVTLPEGMVTSWNLSMTRNRNLYFDAFVTGSGTDIYRCQWINGQYATPEKLPVEINTVNDDGCSFIDPEEEYILFVSNRPGGFGLHDIYISYHHKNGGWSPSVNLGNWINSSSEDAFPLVSPEGRYLFFNTARNASQDLGYNAYWVSAAFIDLMRPIEPDTSNRVVFFSDRDGNTDIYSMFPDGSDLKRLTNTLFNELDPAWSGDGKQIAFTSDRDGNFELFTMKADGIEIRKLPGTEGQASAPRWSPDGTRILLTVSDDLFSEEGRIATIHADGTGLQIMTGAGQGTGATWTGDGSQIIFSSKRSGSFELYTIGSDGNGLQQITRSPTDKINARVSPDGRSIAYTQVSQDGSDTEIHLMNADGTGDIQLTRPGRSSRNPCWSADGKQIYFQTNRYGNHEIYRMDADGKNQVNVTRNSKNDFGPDMIRKSSTSWITGGGTLMPPAQLKSIYPNPAHHDAVIEFSLSKSGHCRLLIMDLTGRPVNTLLDENRTEGTYQLKPDMSGMSPGIYLVIMLTDNEFLSKKIIKN
jgi:Tol biopolymer transport system component